MSKPRVIDIPAYEDDRGYVYCAMDELEDKGIQRTYVVENHSRGMIRAWHGHRKAHTYMHVLRGAIKLVALNMDDDSDVFVATLTDRKPAIFYVPPGYYNGAMSLTDGTKIMVYSTLTFEQVKSDDEREDWKVRRDVWEVHNR